MEARRILIDRVRQPAMAAGVSPRQHVPARALQAFLNRRFNEESEFGRRFDDATEFDGLPDPDGISLVDRVDAFATLVSRFAGVGLFFAALGGIVYALI